jgi:phenylacetate-CoA ligase
MDSITRRGRDLLSQKLLLPLSHARQLVGTARRVVRGAYSEGMRFRNMSAGWSLEQKREWILHRLRFAVRRAYRETQYYRELFDRVGFDPQADFSFQDFAQLPALDREDVLWAGNKLIANSVPAEWLRRDATGGATGKPTEVWLGPEEIGWSNSGQEYFMRRIGLPAGTSVGALWGHHLDPVASTRWRDRYQTFANNWRWFDCFRLSPEVFEHYHQELERWRPACIIAYASALGHFAEYLLEQGHKPNYPTRCLVTGAEKLMPHHRQVIEEVFALPTHERYGSRDVGGMGLQTDPARSLDYELDWANVLIEPERQGPEAPILITKLHADGMPMLRYRVGDLGRFPLGSRPGHPAFRLQEVMGRLMDRVWLRDGRWVHGSQLPHLMKDYPVREFMLTQHTDYSVAVQIVPKAGFGDDCRQQIEALLRANLPELPLVIELVERVPRSKANKWRPVVSEIEPLKAKAA